MTKKRLMSVITAILFLLTVIFSVTLIASSADHECTNSDDCAICAEVNSCRELLHDLSMAQTSRETETRKPVSFRAVKRESLPARREALSTLVSLKTKLSD